MGKHVPDTGTDGESEFLPLWTHENANTNPFPNCTPPPPPPSTGGASGAVPVSSRRIQIGKQKLAVI